MEKYQYFVTKKQYHHTKGVRFFKLDKEDGHAISVCLNTGEKKRGRGNFYGTYIMARQNVFANYVGPGYAEACAAADFELAFAVCMQHLKQKFQLPHHEKLITNPDCLTNSIELRHD